jgi:RNA polymerase sigma-70 factor (ECF subfamily)
MSSTAAAISGALIGGGAQGIRSRPESPTPNAAFDPAGSSWEQIVVDHHAFVLRRARRLTCNLQDAEDLTSEVFVRVFGALHTYAPGGSFRGWLARITTNLYIDQLRRRNRLQFSPLRESHERRLLSREPDPAEAVTSLVLEPRLQEALDALPSIFREVVVMRDLRGLTYEEVSREVGVKQGTVRTRIHRGRSRLRAALAVAEPPARHAVPATPASR